MKRKPVFLLVISPFLCLNLFSQGMGIGTTTPDPKSQLDISSNSRGLLIPRLTSLQRTGIMNPPKGLMVYDSTSQLFFHHDGSTWQGIASASNTWSLSGNTSTNPASQFIGTSDNNPLLFRTNNIKAGLIDHLNHN